MRRFYCTIQKSDGKRIITRFISAEQARLLDRDAGAAPQRMQLVLDSVADDEWLEYVKNWRTLSRGGELSTSPDSFYEMPAVAA